MYKRNISRRVGSSCSLYDTADRHIVPLGGSTQHWNTTIVKFDVVDHAGAVEVVVSFQAVPRAIVLACRIADWRPGSVGNGVEDAAAVEALAVTARVRNDKPPMLAFLRFVHLRGAHDV